MRSLTSAAAVCEHHHPGLLDALDAIPFAAREAADSPVVELYRRHGGPGLLVPEQYGGRGARPLDAVRVQRALAAASPSLGVASVMHHFTVAMLFRLAENASRLSAAQVKLLSSVASDGLLLASGWAEGRTNQNILSPSVTAVRTPDGFLVNGAKKPCSLSRSMDVLTASVLVEEPGAAGGGAEGGGGAVSLALMLIPAGSPGIEVRPFWSSPVLAAAQSDEVRLTDVAVPEELVVISTAQDQHRLDDLQTAGFTWFELLTTAGYVGAASSLAARVLSAGRGGTHQRAELAVRLDAAVALVEGAARALEDGVDGDEAVAAVLTARYAAQDLLTGAVAAAVELLGGMAFISSPEVAYLAAAVHALAFHPPSRGSVAAELADYFAGGPLRLS